MFWIRFIYYKISRWPESMNIYNNYINNLYNIKNQEQDNKEEEHENGRE